ncbi:MAG TPA: hypothetical protein VKQ36_08185 [Ktedonobacterales bacterium]|nr:hypothetical protein [Ktedonobacterales bacterium]
MANNASEPDDAGHHTNAPVEPSANLTRHDGRMLRLARRALRLYPSAWRDRYAEEVTLVLRQSHVTGWTLLDLALGAFDAHLHRNLLPGKVFSMTQRIRTSDIVIFCGYMLYALAWMAMRFVRDPLPVWEHATATHPNVLLAFNAMDAAGIVATLAFLVGGLPILWSVITQTIRASQPKVILALFAPLALIAIFATFTLFTVRYSTATVSHAQNGQLTPLAFALQMAILLLFLLTFAGGIAAVAYAVAHSEVSERLLRFTLIPGAIVTLALVVGLLAALALNGLIITQAPEVGSFGNPVALVMMLVGVALAIGALRRGWRAGRIASPLEPVRDSTSPR